MITILAVLTVLSALTFISQKRLALYLYKYLATKLTDNRSMDKLEATAEKARINTDELKGKQRKNFNPGTCIDEIKRLERRALVFALMCCLFYAATMIGHFQFWAVAQAVLASLGVIAAGSYSLYFHVKKQEALIAIEVHHKMSRSEAKQEEKTS